MWDAAYAVAVPELGDDTLKWFAQDLVAAVRASAKAERHRKDTVRAAGQSVSAQRKPDRP